MNGFPNYGLYSGKPFILSLNLIAHARRYPYRVDEVRNRFLDSLRKAGLPEG